MTSITTAMAMYCAKLSMKGHTANIEACPTELIAQQRFGPMRSTSRPIG